MTPQELLELRRQLTTKIAEARALDKKARDESRAFSTDEQSQYDSLIAEAANMQAQLKRYEQLNGMNGFIGEQNTNRPDAEIGMSDNEARSYSLLRAIRAAATNNWADAGLEREASQAVEQRLGRTAQGFFVPFDWMVRDGRGNRAESRNLNTGTPSEGGNLVATDLLAQSFIDLLRNALTLRTAGASILTGLTGNIDIPKQTSGSAASWIAQDGDAPETQPAFGQIGMTPKTVAAYLEITRRMMLQSSLDVEGLSRSDLAYAIALAVDLAGYWGNGTSNQPKGVRYQTGVNIVSGGTNGAVPTWDHIVAMETGVSTQNALMGSLGYVTNPKVRGKLKTTLKATGVGGYVWENGSTPLNGYPALISNQIPSNLSKGSATNSLSAIMFGNWRDVIIGFWSGLDILVDPYSNSTKGKIRIVAMQDCDIAVRHPESFSVMVDVKTA